MYPNYNINQLTLNLSTEFIPKENHVACFINEMVESLQIHDPYLFGRPREYDLSAMLKLVLFAYTRETFTSRKIQRLAEENIYARWLTQESEPSYRTIAHTLFIDGTKILADANKFSFVWKKIRFVLIK